MDKAVATIVKADTDVTLRTSENDNAGNSKVGVVSNSRVLLKTEKVAGLIKDDGDYKVINVRNGIHKDFRDYKV